MPKPDGSLLAMMAVTAAAIAVLLIGGAGRDAETSRAQREGERVIPMLDHPLDAVASMEVARASGSFVLQRSEHGWSNLGVGGYPALSKPIEQTIGGLAGLTYFAAKTQRARLYPELGVEDVSPQSKSTRVTLKNSRDTVIADIIVGKPKLNIAGLGREGVYIRHPGERRAWLVEGRLDVHRDAPDWSQRSLLNIEPDEVQSLRLKHSDGEVIAFARVPGSVEPFSLLDLAPDSTLEQPAQLNYLAGIMANLNFDDAARHEGTSERKLAVRVIVQSVHGLTVTLDATTVDEDGRVWATISAAESLPQAHAEAKRINSQLAGWIFRLPRSVAQRLSVRRAELVGAKP